ncbi:MAG: V-type ATP synthase subunit E family protein [Chromatiaceae bacterium]|nr:V-type ATP synthase subunit E family protein [Chromatiaceae bacterium]
MNQVQELEKAILARAERLAAEYRERAQRNRDNILRDAAERLRLREQREESIAKSLGERTYRQQVQASELKMQSQLDRMRWNLVTDVQRRLRERIERYKQDEAAYLATLKAYLAQAAAAIEAEELIAQVNAQDHKRLGPTWEAIVEAAAPGKRIVLAPEAIETSGGVLVESADHKIRVNNTFEGRLIRLQSRIQQVILERLLPSGFDTGNVFGG